MYIVRCAQSRAASATLLKSGIENWKGLVRRPQSKTSHTLAWLGDELGVVTAFV
jgi:hypothetical protein